MFASKSITISDLSQKTTTLGFDLRQIRIHSIVKSNPAENGFAVEQISNPCRFVEFVASELVRIIPDTVCPSEDVENNYVKGTHHGHGHLARMCYP